MVKLIDMHYRDGDEPHTTPSCLLWDKENKYLYITHGAMCTMFKQKYQRIEVVANDALKVGEKQTQKVSHYQTLKKLLVCDEPMGREVQIERERVLRKDCHDRRHKLIVDREALWCQLFWKDGDVLHQNVDCVRVLATHLNSVFWEHIMSFLLGQMGVIHPRRFFDE